MNERRPARRAKPEVRRKRFEERGVIFRRSDSIGNRAEENVFEALSALPQVLSIRQSAQYSPDDLAGIDMTARLDTSRADVLVGAVSIQVKASRHLIAEYRKKLRVKYRLSRVEQDDWLAKKRWILLDGFSRNIQQDFLTQLVRVNTQSGA